MSYRDMPCPSFDSPEDRPSTTQLSRRRFLLCTTAGLGLTVAGPALALNKERCLSLYAPNTGETLRLVYWTPTEGYINESIQEISYLLRDHRNDLVKRFDSKLLDALFGLQLKLEPRQPIHTLSGYRSPQTNAMLRSRSRAVAKNSYHMRGQAVDIRMPDRDFNTLHHAALAMEAGGVGRYRHSRFIHIDTGPVRRWG
jgi:uncharacterized protein YcbK (DUF882 family)